MLLPEDFIYHTQKVHIHRGVVYDGYIAKAELGSKHRSIIRLLEKEYSKERTIDFVNNVQFIANEWMCWHGFSIGISDCIATKQDEIQDIVSKSFIEAEYIENSIDDTYIKEAKINMSLSKAKDVGMKIATEAFTEDNNFVSTVTSGSKGDYFNIAQITGLLGQQNLVGKRVQPCLNHNTRTLHHYPFNQQDKASEYESRGFIKNSFFHGLNPREFWFHAMSGREGVTDKHAVSVTADCHTHHMDKQCTLLVQFIWARYLTMTGNSLEIQLRLVFWKHHTIPRVMTSGIVITLNIGQSAGNGSNLVMARV
jgi:DNA-directed RNA polymerase beta' subunit